MESHPLLSSESELSRLPGTAPTQFNPSHSYHKAKAFKKFRQLFFILEARQHSSRNSARLRYLHTWAMVSSCHQASMWLSETLLKTCLHHLKSGIREGIQKQQSRLFGTTFYHPKCFSAFHWPLVVVDTELKGKPTAEGSSARGSSSCR